MRAYALEHLSRANVDDSALFGQVRQALHRSIENAPEDGDSPLRGALREAVTKGCEEAGAEFSDFHIIANLLAADRDVDRFLRVLAASDKMAGEAWNQARDDPEPCAIRRSRPASGNDHDVWLIFHQGLGMGLAFRRPARRLAGNSPAA